MNFPEFNLRNKSILMSEVFLILQTFNKNYVKLQPSCFISTRGMQFYLLTEKPSTDIKILIANAHIVY